VEGCGTLDGFQPILNFADDLQVPLFTKRGADMTKKGFMILYY
jgi:hypothetical protein